jgi:hypothetical protein
MFTSCAVYRSLNDILAKKNKNISDPRKMKTIHDLTELERAQQEDLRTAMEAYGVSPSQVVYLADWKGSYVGESSDVLERFLQQYQIILEKQFPLVFRDNGHAFMNSAKEPLLPKYGCIKDVPYPAAVHQWISPNDQTFHGRTKAGWKTDPEYAGKDLQSAFALLKRMNGEFVNGHSNTVAQDFLKNFWLTAGTSRNRADLLASVLKHMGKTAHSGPQRESMAEFVQTHEVFRRQAEKHSLVAVVGIDSALNGRKLTISPTRPKPTRTPRTK